jgi:hypothetical protein
VTLSFPISRRLSRTLALLGLAATAQAATVTWTGNTSTDFEAATNWTALPTNDLTTDLAEFSSLTANLPRLSNSRSVTGLLFSNAGGGWTLSAASGNQALSLGASGLNAAAQTSGTNTISADLVVTGNQTWQVGTGGTLVASGSVRLGAAGTPLTSQLTIGAGSNAGELVLDPVSGDAVAIYSNLANAAALQVNQRLTLGSASGAADSVNVIQNTASAGVRVGNTGALTVRSGTWRTNDLGSNNSSAFTGSLTITGGTLATGGARYLGQFNGANATTVTLSGGNLLVTGGGNSVVNSGYLGLGTTGVNTPSGRITFTQTGGLLDVARGLGTNPGGVTSSALVLGGVANTTVHFNQSGGTVRVGVTSGSDVFTGTTNNNTFTNLTLGGNFTGNTTTNANNLVAYTLSGGSLTVAGTLTAVPSAGGINNFNFLGGTLTAGGIDASNLGSSSTATTSANQTAESVSIGTLLNRGGTLAPGGDGVAGRTLVTGNYTATGGQLLLDIGGTTQATAFQTGTHDFLSVTGNATLGGTLAFKVSSGFTPTALQNFTVLTATGNLSGAFSNVAFGNRLASADGLHTFVVSRSGNSVVLGNYAAATAPTITSAIVPSAIVEGATVVLGITTSSLSPVTYLWRRDGVVISGATSSTLTLVNLAPADEGIYQVTATNAVGSVAQSFTVRPSSAPSNGREVVDFGSSRTFNASAGASSYRWVLDGEDVGTGASFTYTPTRRAVGVHWLRVIETYADASKLTREWAVQVRLPAFTGLVSYYVSPTGSDTNPGSLAAPFATLEKARDTIRLLSTGAKAGGVTVFLRGGVHRRTSTFTLAAQDSGTDAAPIQYVAYPGETPILTTSRVISSAQIAPLAASEQARVAPGVNAARIWEIDVTGNARANAFPAVFNEWIIFNAFRSTQNGGLLELFYQGERKRLSRYPNDNPTDDRLTPNILMDGVATGTSIVKDPTTGNYVTTTNSYLNFAGTYTPAGGSATAVGGAFVFPVAEASRVARWSTAINAGGLWVMGYWRVPWQINGARVSLIDATNRVIGLATNATNANDPLISGGIGDKYSRTANTTLNLGLGSKKEPWWVVNLLEEMDVPGEWAIDFNRRKIYFLMGTDGAPADGDIELTDVSTPLIQFNGASDVRLEGLTFRRHLGVNVQILNGARNLVRGCTFTQSGNMAVDINGGTDHGVLSSDFEKLASGGIMLRGGSVTIPSGSTVPSAITPSNHFAVNNRFRSFSEVVRVYQAAIDAGFGGPIGSWSVNPVVAGMRIANNDIRTSPHAGILWHGYQHVIEYNELSDFTRISNDFGGIYRYGPNQDNQTVIRYNHLFSSTVGEGIYNDFDHVRTPIYGNVINLKTPSTSSRGYGIWTNTNPATGGAVAGIPTALQVYNNISVNGRSNYSLHSATGGKIENNISYRKLASDFLWYRITTNTTTNTQSVATSNAATLASGANPAYTVDPGFVDFANDDLRLRPDAQVYTDLPNFTPIPLELSGTYVDTNRTTGTRVWKPFSVTRSVTSLGANTATLNGTLAYPQFDANATVRVYWGTTDGGDDPAAWQNTATLGQLRAGPLAYTPTNLAPGTKYFYRFAASNSAGDHWAERSNFTTTYAFVVTPPSGTAGADTAALPAANAFDGDAATLWRANAATATLNYTYSEPTRVTRYSLVSSTDSAARDPRDWTLQASNDGVTWVTLDTQTAQAFATRGETRTYGFVNDNRWLQYRLVVSANNGDTSALSLAELTFSVPQDTPDTTGPVIVTPGQIVVSGTASGAIVTFTVSATDAVSGEVTATATPASGSTFAVGDTTVNVSATDGAGNTSTASFVVTVLPPSLPAPWTLRQITPYTGVAAGTVIASSTTSFSIAGTGGASTGGTTGDFWTGNNDSFTYLSQPWTGDGIFTARVASFTSSDTSAKVGIVFRETTATGSRYSAVYYMRTGSGTVTAQHKTATSGATTNTNFFSTPITGRNTGGTTEWLRLVRSGDTFSTFYSEDGTTWTELGTARTNVLAGAALSVGFVIAPRTGNTTATVTFDNVSFLTPLQAWRLANFSPTAAPESTTNSADPDGDGLPNLLEYGFGSNPQTPTTAATTTALVDQLLQITFFRARADLTYYVDVSEDLSTWSVLATNPGTVGQTVTVSDFVPLSTTTPRRFLRVRVETP